MNLKPSLGTNCTLHGAAGERRLIDLFLPPIINMQVNSAFSFTAPPLQLVRVEERDRPPLPFPARVG